jgi:ribosomal protein S18 acetylase RimI-like enzyme
VRAARLRTPQLEALTALLSREPVVNLFLLDLLTRRGMGSWRFEEWYGVFDGDVMISAALLIGREAPGGAARLGVAYGADEGCVLIGQRARWSGPVDMLIGHRAASDALWEGLEGAEPSVFFDQRLYTCRGVPGGEELALRAARPEEAAQLEALSGQMMVEDLGVDPRVSEPVRHRLAVAGRISGGRTLVADINGEICFILDIGTRQPHGAQVGGTFVPERFRGRGVATCGMRSAVKRLLAAHDSVSLHVNEANLPAIRCYERVGFQRGVPFRLLIR